VGGTGGADGILFKIFQNLSAYRSYLQFKEIIKSPQKTLEPGIMKHLLNECQLCIVFIRTFSKRVLYNKKNIITILEK